ncbi:helix-turn-helix domain-containing protein [Saccharomonospora saliphila]|uniref:helix-turn-helix domain-containing protein n=1 Tax=Saccharomonospora saliphila TaxID=369829 RepID=UPI00048AF4B4|nr:helix-turn-helix transcriptional regulator [Saccharomonospora saliphila]
MSGTKPEAPEARAYVLGAELRALRTHARLTQRALADRMGCAHTVLTRWERGERIPDPAGIEAFARALDLSAVERDQLIHLAREAADQPVNEVSTGAHGEAGALATMIEFEHVATDITAVSNMLVPGLMQTADYARSVLGDKADVETKVATRVGRREAITRERSPVRYTAYMLETVLTQQLDRDVMLDQLRLIRRLADLPNVCVRIIPSACGITPAHLGSFVLLEFAKADPIVQMEHLSSIVFLRDRGDVEAYTMARASLNREAMSPADSAELIADVIKKGTTL